MFCPDHEGDCFNTDGTTPGPKGPCCIDISQQITDGMNVEMNFDIWWELEGTPYDWCELQFHPGCPDDTSANWETLDIWRIPFGWAWSSYFYTGLYSEAGSDGWISPWFGGPYDLDARCAAYSVTEFALRFVFQSDGGWNYRGVKLDDITISNFYYHEYPAPYYTDFIDPCDNMSNWCTGQLNTGQFWFHRVDRTGNAAHTGTYCNWNELDMVLGMIKNGIFEPGLGETFVPLMDDALIWTTEIADSYKAFLTYEVNYRIDDVDANGQPCARMWVEIDDGSDTWWVLCEYDADDVNSGNSGGWITENFDISFLAGKPIQIRFRVNTDVEYTATNNRVYVRNVQILGKQDHTAPVSSITMTGTMKDSGWFNTAVNVKITASDNIGMGEIHYILDGVETVVSGNIAEFTVSGNGQHTLEYWAVDAMGNEEGHHIVPPFRIDSGSAPTVAITAPEPGLYLFGNKILSASKVIIIGAFTIEATASDAESGIYKVQFYLDGDVIAEDTEVPFSAYCAVKHMGEGTIKVVAEDFAQNTAEDTLDITYYKFL
jgi:hypothetical protein